MPEAQTQPANSLTQVLGQSERVKDMVEECADDLSTVNAGLKRELLEGEISPAVEIALEKSEAVEGMYQEKRDKSRYSLFSELLIWPD
jgi:hypothetical protein